jgi:hypothetical protein
VPPTDAAGYSPGLEQSAGAGPTAGMISQKLDFGTAERQLWGMAIGYWLSPRFLTTATGGHTVSSLAGPLQHFRRAANVGFNASLITWVLWIHDQSI